MSSFPVVRNYEEERWFQTLVAHQSCLNDFEHCNEGMLVLLGVSRLGVEDGRNYLPDGGGMELLESKNCFL